MKVCKKCGVEISTRDGINICVSCAIGVNSVVTQFANNRDKGQRECILLDLGLHKVKGAMGGIYWE